MDDVSRVALLPPARQSRGAEYARFWFTMLISFLPFMALCLTVHYSVQSFGAITDFATYSIASMRRPFECLWVCFAEVMQLFALDHGFVHSFERPELLERALRATLEMSLAFSDMLFGPTGSARFYFRSKASITLYDGYFAGGAVPSFFEGLLSTR
jgi:hypothetical protein